MRNFDGRKTTGVEPQTPPTVLSAPNIFMRTSIFLRRNLAGIQSSRGTSFILTSSPRSAVYRPSTQSRHCGSQARPLRIRQSLTPWTITENELRNEEMLVESVRRGIWEGLSGGMPDGCQDPRMRQSPTNKASRQNIDKRARNDKENETKRRKLEKGEELHTPIYATHFSQEDIENEQRRPKKKVAVLLGYSGTGYKGMQLCVIPAGVEWWGPSG